MNYNELHTRNARRIWLMICVCMYMIRVYKCIHSYHPPSKTARWGEWHSACSTFLGFKPKERQKKNKPCTETTAVSWFYLHLYLHLFAISENILCRKGREWQQCGKQMYKKVITVHSHRLTKPCQWFSLSQSVPGGFGTWLGFYQMKGLQHEADLRLLVTASRWRKSCNGKDGGTGKTTKTMI